MITFTDFLKLPQIKSGLTNQQYLEERLPNARVVWDRSEFEADKVFTIVNVNDETTGVGHWVLIYRNVFLDSYGNPPPDEIAEVLLKKYGSMAVNTKKMQYTNSENCGNYCLYFAHLIKKGFSPNDIIEFQV